MALNDWLRRAALIGALATCACNKQARAKSGREVDIRGDFLADGSCRVYAAGVPLYSPSENARTIYLRDRAMNMAPAGFEVHEVWCAPVTAGEPMLPDQPGDRAFFVNVYAPAGKLAPTRDYIVKRGMPSSDRADVVALRANVSLFDPSIGPAHNTRASTAPGVSYLTGTSGVVRLTHVDSTHVTGTLHVHAVPEWSM